MEYGGYVAADAAEARPVRLRFANGLMDALTGCSKNDEAWTEISFCIVQDILQW